MPKDTLKHSRILLKLSGEALAGDSSQGVDLNALNSIAQSIHEIHQMGVQVAIVIGGGNFLRGSKFSGSHFDRVTADQMGMLFTISNGLALAESLRTLGAKTMLMSSVTVSTMTTAYDRTTAIEALDSNHIVIFTGGLGLPLFSTDSAASLRAIEINADIILKASTVDAVYDSDPKKNPDAKPFGQLTYQKVIEQQLGVMDLTAICLCLEHNMPIRVFNLHKNHILKNIVTGHSEGTLITH